MKRGPFSFHPFYQFPDPIGHSLIRDPERHALVMLDLAVEFDALVTHCLPALLFRRKRLATCQNKTTAGCFGFMS
jgi:hypothetical protein